MRLDTKLIHAGEPTQRLHGAVVMPVFQSSTFENHGEQSYHDLRYIRLNNTPGHDVLHAKLAALEGSESALVTASGMAAISTTLLTLLPAGSHLLAQQHLYGGTHDFLTQDLPAMGVEVSFVDPAAPQTWAAALRPNTRVFYIETLSNPLLGLPEVEAVATFARENSLHSVIDNTFASPVNFRPVAHGIDLVVHSATKYLNGHNDIVAGVVCGSEPTVRQITHRLNHLGGSLDPHACFLLHRGLKTLGLRVRFQNDSALTIAQFLSQQPAVTRVNYPGLETHPQHPLARRLLEGYGGMLSFELSGGAAAAEAFLAATTYPIVAPSLGGVDSLITRPAATSHAGMDPELRRRNGISDGLIRFSVGIEATEDLIEDFTQALQAV